MITCPYCEHKNDAPEGGWPDGELRQIECEKCQKTFVFYASVSIDYHASKADCLNGAAHHFWDWRKTWIEGGKQVHSRACKDCQRTERALTAIGETPTK